jgi:hypothetical protein
MSAALDSLETVILVTLLAICGASIITMAAALIEAAAYSVAEWWRQ